MTGKAHLISGFILGIALATKTQAPASCVFSCVIGSLFADTDHKQSILGRIIPLWLLFRPHRLNVLHSFKGLLVLSLLWLCLDSWLGACFFAAGYFVHLCLDSLTKMGIPWLWPNPKMFSIATVVNGIGELIILFAFYTIVITTMSVF